MKRLSTLALQFYQSIWLYNLACTIVIIFLGALAASSISISFILFTRMIVFASAAGLYYFTAKDSYFYYRNAGYSVRRVHLAALLIDLLIFSTLYLLITCLH